MTNICAQTLSIMRRQIGENKEWRQPTVTHRFNQTDYYLSRARNRTRSEGGARYIPLRANCSNSGNRLNIAVLLRSSTPLHRVPDGAWTLTENNGRLHLWAVLLVYIVIIIMLLFIIITHYVWIMFIYCITLGLWTDTDNIDIMLYVLVYALGYEWATEIVC